MSFLKKIKDIRKNKSLLNGALFAIFSFINKGFVFFLLLFLAEFITPAEYGNLNLFITIVMLIGFFISFSTEGYLSVSYFRDGEYGVKQTFSCAFWTSIIVAFILISIILSSGSFLSTKLDISSKNLLFAVGISLFAVFFNMWLNIFRLERKVFVYGFLSCGNSLLFFLAALFFVIYCYGWEGYVYARFMCYFAFGTAAIIFFIVRKAFVIPNISHWKMMLCWGIPLIPHLATVFIRQGCDRFIINHYHTIEDVGFFSFALTLANAIMMVGIGFNQSNSVDIFSVLGDKNFSVEQKKSSLAKQNKNLIFVYCFASIFVFTICMLLVPWILPKYLPAMRFFPALSVYAFLHCIYLLYTNFLFYFKKTRNLMYITFFSSILHLTCSLFLTKYSLYYTSFIYVGSQLIIVLLVRRFALKMLNEEFS